MGKATKPEMILVRVTSPNIEEEEEAHVVSEFQYPLHHRLFALLFAETNWFPATQSPPPSFQGHFTYDVLNIFWLFATYPACLHIHTTSQFFLDPRWTLSMYLPPFQGS